MHRRRFGDRPALGRRARLRPGRRPCFGSGQRAGSHHRRRDRRHRLPFQPATGAEHQAPRGRRRGRHLRRRHGRLPRPEPGRSHPAPAGRDHRTRQWPGHHHLGARPGRRLHPHPHQRPGGPGGLGRQPQPQLRLLDVRVRAVQQHQGPQDPVGRDRGRLAGLDRRPADRPPARFRQQRLQLRPVGPGLLQRPVGKDRPAHRWPAELVERRQDLRHPWIGRLFRTRSDP
ncbi:hypothetical protein D3C72_918180 [compost metagenome]